MHRRIARLYQLLRCRSNAGPDDGQPERALSTHGTRGLSKSRPWQHRGMPRPLTSPTARINLARFDLLSLRLALLCAQGRTLTAAAQDCHLALAAASRRLRELESALGMPLFDRVARTLVPTAAAQTFVPHAAAVLAGMERLAADLGDLQQGVARRLRLVASTAALNQFLPPLLARWAEQHPAWSIDVDEQVSTRVVAALRERRADVGILIEGGEVEGLETRVFRHDELCVLLPPRHPLARSGGPLAFASLLDEDWIGLSTGAAVLASQQQAAVAAGKALRLRMQVRSFDAVCQLVAAGLGLALLPRSAVASMARSLGIVMRPLAEPWGHRRMLVARRTDVLDPQVDALVGFLCADAARPRAGRSTRAKRATSQNANKPRRKRQ
jgi:DNA-binding transcriptional LysR family regulator